MGLFGRLYCMMVFFAESVMDEGVFIKAVVDNRG